MGNAYRALVFLVIAIVAGILGFSGGAGDAAELACLIFVVGLVLAIVFFLSAPGEARELIYRRRRVARGRRIRGVAPAVVVDAEQRAAGSK